jgi:hypothetical protein
MHFVTIIGTIVFFAVILLALSAVIEIIFAPPNKNKINGVDGAVRKKTTWFRKRRALVTRHDQIPEATRRSPRQ